MQAGANGDLGHTFAQDVGCPALQDVRARHKTGAPYPHSASGHTQNGVVPSAFDPPTTIWGTLRIAADLLEEAGLARLATIRADYDAGKLSVFAALQDALWQTFDQVPNIDGGIPRSCKHDPRCALYWDAIRVLDRFCGGPGDVWTEQIDKFTEPPDATAAGVADMMRQAAQHNRVFVVR